MIKIFNHYIHRRTLLQVLLDFGLVAVALLVAAGWQAEHPLGAATAAIPTAAVLAVVALVINSALGFYQRVHNRSVAQSRARGVLSLVLLLPLRRCRREPAAGRCREFSSWSASVHAWLTCRREHTRAGTPHRGRAYTSAAR